jgi:hypothetical protein
MFEGFPMTLSLPTSDIDYLSPDGRPPAIPFLHSALSSLASTVDALSPDRPKWTAGELARLTQLLVDSAPEALSGLVRHDPVHRWYGRVALTDQVEVWLIGWAPGQGTRPHDHGGASGAFTVLAGELTETYRDGAAPLRSAVLAAGGTSSFGPERLHVVANAGRVNATSVQAYSPPRLPMGLRTSLDGQP